LLIPVTILVNDTDFLITGRKQIFEIMLLTGVPGQPFGPRMQFMNQICPDKSRTAGYQNFFGFHAIPRISKAFLDFIRVVKHIL